MENTWFTTNNKGDIGCHDADKLTAEQDLAIMSKKYPDEGWEMFDASEED